MTVFPPVASDSIGETLPAGIFGYGADPAKYVIQLRRFLRPRFFIEGGDSFEFPLGSEAVRVTGGPLLAEHRYIGDNASSVQVIHRDARRIEMSGVFPGRTGEANMRALLELIVAEDPPAGKKLDLPGIFPKEQLVKVESYDFSMDSNEGSGSWNYTVTFIREGIGAKIKAPKVINPPDNPSTTNKPNKGSSARYFQVRDGYRTLRAIAQLKYRDAQKWRRLYDLNQKAISKLGIPMHAVPTKPLPLGMKIRY